MIILYPIFVLIIFYVVGLAVIKFFKLQDTRLVKDNNIIAIAIGYVFNMTILETLGMLLPIYIVSIASIAVFIIALIWCFKDLKISLLGKVKYDKGIFLILLAIIVVLMLPQIIHEELFVVVDGNNDMGYYIASIDWLKNHTIFEIVDYTHAYPLYSMAEYMIDLTRIGTDLTGAFVASVFSIEAHQALSVLAPISGIMIFVSIYSVSRYFTNSHFSGTIIGLYAAISGNCISLITMQYVPQVFGVSYLLLVFISLYELLLDKSKEASILVGLFVSGVLAIYCEYTIYLCIVFLFFMIVSIVKKKINIKSIFYAGIYSIGFNVFGFYKAVKFNINVLFGVLNDGLEMIDAYQGNMMSIWRKIGVLFGLTAREFTNIGLIYKFFVILGFALIIICCFILPIMKKRYEQLLFSIATVGVVVLLETYFLYGKAAYEEYKNLTSAAFIILANVSIILGELVNSVVHKRVLKWVSFSAITCISMFSMAIPLKNYIRPFAAIDSSVMELQEAAMLVPSNKEIALDNNLLTADYMGAVYALKNRVLKLSSGASSYLHFFQTFEEDNKSKYTIFPKTRETEVISNDGIILWANQKYMLVENEEIKSYQRLNICGSGWQYQSNVKVFQESGSIITSGLEGYALFGPYVPINGVYNIKLDYTVLQAGEGIGYFDVCDGGDIIITESLDSSLNSIEIKNVYFENKENVEFRVFTNSGTVIKVEGISLEKSE